jgi:glycosyltransferase involved in cell wall biosynthesis
MMKNRDIYRARNAAFLAKQPVPDIERIDTLAFWRGRSNRHVVLVEDFAPAQAIGSGFARSTDIVDSFLRNGWRVTIWAVHKRPGIEPRDDGLCETLFEPDYPGGLERFLKAAGRSVDLFWVCRTHNFKRVGERIQKWRAELPAGAAPRVVYDTEAIASVRNWLTAELAVSERIDVSNIGTKVQHGLVARELALAGGADMLVVMNDIDRQLAATVIDKPIAILSHCFQPRPTPAKFGARSGLLFCGAIHESASPNYDSLVWFSNKVLPLLRKDMKDLLVTIVGYWKPDVAVPECLRQDGIRMIGGVDDLEPCFANARLFIAPTRVAAGMPHKVQQSMAYGLPAVVTPILAEQLKDASGNAETTFTAADFTADAFAKQVMRAYADEAAWNRVREAALASIRTHANPEAFARTIEEISAMKAGAPDAAR